jgi:broad specificity phosphatase PhoE
MRMPFVIARRRLFFRMLTSLALAVALAGYASTGTPSASDVLAQPGHVLLMRHAHAPGVGDPEGMTLDDCSTQRNLDARGRRQASELGLRLKTAGVSDIRVYTSQWCRCRETARLLNMGRVEDLPALNSFFEQPETRDAKLAALRAFLDRLPRDGRPVVLVTHQVTVTALTGYFPASGDGLVLKLKEGGGFERAAELSASEE